MDNPDKHLSPRMVEVLTLLSAGNTYAEVACMLFIEVRTVKQHAYRAVDRLGAKTVIHAVAIFVMNRGNVSE